MGSSVEIYGGEADCRALEEYADSLGLQLIAPSVGRAAPTLGKDGPYCFLSIRPTDELHPFGAPLRYTDSKDPLIRFMRPYYTEPFLVLGHVYRSTDVASLAALTEFPYRQISRWIRSNWAKHGDFYVGPEAAELLAEGAQKANVLPGSASLNIVKY
jgi:hypothetical protein